MVFSSIPFLFFLLPISLVLYYAVPYSVKNYILLAFSLLFYAWGEPVYITLMLFETLSDYTLGRVMDGSDSSVVRRVCLILSIVIDLSVLGFFKYADFLIGILNNCFRMSISPIGLGLPIGISFFTFQTMSYTIDLYRKEVKVEKNYLYYLTYVSMFPQLIAGPIVRFSTVNEEIHNRKIDMDGFVQGLLRFLIGLSKKVLIANLVGALWETIKVSTSLSVAAAWLGAVCFTLQLYFDFSAYSDMAIGLGRMLGFHYLENFYYPLASVSVTDFWRRWHISLGSWFRDYVYIPLGGNRVSVLCHLRNMFIVWFLTGLWHGAAWNFIFWGVYYGILLSLEKYVYGKALKQLPVLIQHIYALFIVVFGFVIFVFDDLGELGRYCRILFGLGGCPLFDSELLWYFSNYGILLTIAVLTAFPVYPVLSRWIGTIAGKGRIQRSVAAVFCSLLYIGAFILCTAYLVNDTYNPFLYFRF